MGYKFWNDAIDAIAEAKRSRDKQLEDLRLIKNIRINYEATISNFTKVYILVIK